MVYFVNSSWQFLTKVQICSGVWPNQHRVKKWLIRFIIVSVLISVATLVLVALRPSLRPSRRIIAENINGALLSAIMLTKLSASCIYTKRSSKIYEKVNDHFRTITDAEEASILNKYADNAMKYSIKYMAISGMAGGTFIGLPIIKMLFKFLLYNEFERAVIYYADYGILNQDKYYVFQLLHILAIAVAIFVATYAYDYAFIIKSRHVCALFEIAKVRLQGASALYDQFEWGILDFRTADNQAYERITKAIDLHNKALEMVPLLEDNYSVGLFVILFQNMISFSGGVYILLMILDCPFDLFRYSFAFVVMLIHFFLLFSHGQMIIDSSSSIHDACYNVKWYLASTKTRKLLSIMMSRSSRPCQITGGGLFLISMETYGKMMKVGLSYFSVFQ